MGIGIHWKVDGSIDVTEQFGHGDSDPSWSPDSQSIMFSSYRQGSSELYIVQANGTGLKQMTNTQEEPASPAWSPTQPNLIAFTAQLTPEPQKADAADREHDEDENPPRVLKILNLESGESHILLNDPVASPVWRPDGMALLCKPRNKPTEVWLIDSGSGAHLDRYSFSFFDHVQNMGWSPDGQAIAFVGIKHVKQSFESRVYSLPFTQVYIYNINAQTIEQLTATDMGHFYGTLSWSPDGNSLAVQVGHETLIRGIDLIDLKTGYQKRLVTGDAISRSPAWSPDGSSIAFDRNGWIYVWNMKKRDVKRVTG